MKTTTLGKSGLYGGQGIWIEPDIAFDIHGDSDIDRDRDGDDDDDESGESGEDDSEDETDGTDGDSEENQLLEEGDDDHHHDKANKARGKGQFQSGMFAALSLDDNEEDDESGDDEG